MSQHDRLRVAIVGGMSVAGLRGKKIFEATGAGATSSTWGLDRFWRNARTLTLHDRLDYKVHDLGQWYLNDQWPTPSFYS